MNIMGWLGGLSNKMKEKMKGWLEIQPAQITNYSISEKYNLETNAIKNKIWMRADPYELQQFYKQTWNEDASFWGAAPTFDIRKIHSGLPALMVDTLTGITLRDFNGIELNNPSEQVEFEEIMKENDFEELLKEAVQTCLVLGDGAFKGSFDPNVSDKIILEFYPADQIELVKKRGRLVEIVFKTVYEQDKKKYMLKEHYGFGYIKYVLSDLTSGDPLPLDSIPQTAELFDVKFAGYQEDSEGRVAQKGTLMMACFMKIYDSAKWKGRGSSIFDKKVSNFDAFDEIISQWADAVRNGRAISYIPETLIPHNPETGTPMKPNSFDIRFIKTEGNGKEGVADKIETVQPEIKSQNYLDSYVTFLDLCLQGLISPSTLGIDTKKLDNAEAQREKEKTTLATRGNIIDALQRVIPLVVNMSLQAMDVLHQKTPRKNADVTVNFGEYASPSFEATIETVGKARTNGIMSTEAAVEEMYGDSKDDDWKAEEVRRIKEEQGITVMNEPYISNIEDEEDSEDVQRENPFNFKH